MNTPWTSQATKMGPIVKQLLFLLWADKLLIKFGPFWVQEVLMSAVLR